MDLLKQIRRFEDAAHLILAEHEDASKSRVITLEESYRVLEGLSIAQDDLFRQSFRCAEAGLYRAAHVMCWAALMDYIQGLLQEVGLPAIRKAYPNWKLTRDVSELAEYIPEAQLIQALQTLGVCTKNEVKALVGLLNKRNECAHPSAFLPGPNETLGYISECIQRLKSLECKS